jgi:hypothetical protein
MLLHEGFSFVYESTMHHQVFLLASSTSQGRASLKDFVV